MFKMFNSEELYTVIKQIAINAVRNTRPCDWCYGNIVSLSPLRVSLDEKLEIDNDFIEFGNRKLENLKIGDKLILLRKAGGQLFLCLDVVEGGD